jgi:hypothetical protein
MIRNASSSIPIGAFTMKLRNVSLAALAVCGAAASSPSFALLASAYNNASETSGNTLNIRITGASAQDNGILGSALQYCLPGTLHRYSISNNFVYFCSPDTGTGTGQITVPSGKTKLAIYKYSVGGSGTGAQELNDNTDIPFLDLTKLSANSNNAVNGLGTTGTFTGTFCTATASASFGYTTFQVLTTGTLTASATVSINTTYVNVACFTATSHPFSNLATPAKPYIGLTDVEPAFFDQSGAGFLNLGKLDGSPGAEPSYTLIFAVPVTLNVRNRLQTLQGLSSGDESEGNMPSLSRSQIQSIYSQGGQTWTGIGIPPGGAFADSIYVARRVDSSGTQKTYEAVIGETPNGYAGGKSCKAGTNGFVAPDSGLVGLTTGDDSATCGTGGAPQVFAGSGGGDVRTCLNNHHGAGHGAVGILTSEDKPGANNWRFVKVDGVTPSQANVANGRYQFWVASTIQKRINVNPTSAQPGYDDFLARLVADLKSTSVINAINGGQQHWSSGIAFGGNFGVAYAGLMANLESPATPNFTGSIPVNPWNRLVGGSTLDNCQKAVAPF